MKKTSSIDIMVIAGTRPEVIKLCELVRRFDFCNKFYVYTGQHYSVDMKDIFFDELESIADVDLACHTSEVEIIKKKIVDQIHEKKPLLVIVYGDTNSTLAGALAANETKTKLIHIEAGLRSFDLRMPEEQNRIKIDRISDYLLCPTSLSKEFLKFEGITKNVFLSGNLIVDVCKKFSKLKLHTKNKRESKYILLTLHRAENADDKDSLRILVNKLKEISNHKIIFPIHPRTKKNLKKHHIKIPKNVKTIDPVGYLEFLRLLRESKLVLTDSGGLQEEAIIFKIPCITLRYTTERWETILCGGNRLYPLLQNNQSFSVVINKMLKAKIKNQPYGKSPTKDSIKIIKKILNNLKKTKIN